MPLWTNADTVAGKPAIGGRAYNEEYKRQLFATAQGWAKVGAGRATTGKDHEVLVAIRGLSTAVIGGGGATAVKANITSINWNISSWSRAAGGTLSMTVNFNEAITITGESDPSMTLNNSARANLTLEYSEALSTANRWTFTKTIAANHASIQAGDVLGIVATNQVDAGEGNTITGADGQAALITHAADMGQGTITATA
tara:strand:- start:85 stop:681 length:597 start_codon:yes stop_codon:yes gene_type:complete